MIRVCSLVLALSGTALAQEPSISAYSRAMDRPADDQCTRKTVKPGKDGPGHCEIKCKGPVASLETKLLSCYDYDHLFLKVDGKYYSTWTAMTAVGGLSGLGHKEGLIEWVFSGKKAGRDALIGLIVRFDGIVDPESNKRRSQLAIFGLRKEEMCWKGNATENTAARKLLATGKCKEKLPPES